MVNFIASLWEIIWEVLGWFEFAKVLDEWEGGVVLRLGKYHRTVGRGLCWHLPFNIEEVHVLNVKPDAMSLDAQSVTTLDGKKITVRVVILWAVFNCKRAICDVENVAETLGLIAHGHVAQVVKATSSRDIHARYVSKDIKRAIQKSARKFGITVSEAEFIDVTPANAIRLLAGGSHEGL